MVEAINGYNVYTVPQRGKGKKHLANATMATVGLATTTGLAYGGVKAMADPERFKIGKTLRKVFEPLGEKVFKGKVGEIFKRYETRPGRKLEVILENAKHNKGVAALVGTAIVAGLGILATTLYNAGHINAKQTVVVAED
jgi:hypothetical protein